MRLRQGMVGRMNDVWAKGIMSGEIFYGRPFRILAVAGR